MKVAIAPCNWRHRAVSIGHLIIRQAVVNSWLVSCAVYQHETATRGIGSRRDGVLGCAAVDAGCASPFDVCLLRTSARRRHRRIVPGERSAIVDGRHCNSGAICGSTVTEEAWVMEGSNRLCHPFCDCRRHQHSSPLCRAAAGLRASSLRNTGSSRGGAT